ncbi:ATPase [Streptomyces sp. LP05-1]|uniref:ATPase n=1 Tax=Streptomyces pyxinae TaxID=2970734 RepID=A0ABT2CMW5_9ACTN|nr:BadF/BadG/BcrA/BcrD ATPase family protein [Streptomyces sp. LP05-1]MCS0638586.1 ATPase [Streptomyces sp. LP05-1]
MLAVDAGNSKTDVAVVGADGTLLGSARGGGFQPPVVGVAAAMEVLAAAVAAAWAATGLPGPPYAARVSACLANADLPVEEAELTEAVAARGWGGAVRVRNDTFAVLRAGVAEPRGVAVVCGAGINCVGLLPDGRTARFPALGRISGDWGGGSGLGEEALWYAARAHDGRGEPTSLVRELPARLGYGSVPGLIEAVHLGHAPADWRHRLAPVVFAAGAAGDLVAGALVERLAREVVALAAVALERLGLLADRVPVLLGGGVLAARHPGLNPRIAALLAERAPRAEVRVVTEPPVLGAALLGLDELAASAPVLARLRAAYGAGAGYGPGPAYG